MPHEPWSPELPRNWGWVGESRSRQLLRAQRILTEAQEKLEVAQTNYRMLRETRTRSSRAAVKEARAHLELQTLRVKDYLLKVEELST